MEEKAQSNRVYYVIGFVVLLLVLVFIAFYSMFYQPMSEKVVKQGIELEQAKKDLTTIGKNFVGMAATAEQDKKTSDSLYKDWKKRITTQYQKSEQYEKDITFINNSNFDERIRVLSEWINKTNSK